jgi:Bacterial Ig-like domain
MKTANIATVQLNSPDGNVLTRIVPAEGGMLAFVTPANPLSSATTYTIALTGIQDAQGLMLADSFISFTTVGKKDSAATGGAIVGTGAAGGSNDSSAQKLPPLKAPKGVTALQAGPGWALSFMHYCTNTWTNPISDESFSHPGSPGGRCGCNTGPM